MSQKFISIFFYISDVRLRRMRSYHIRAGGTLHAFEKTAPIFPGASKILWQKTLQIHERDIR